MTMMRASCSSTATRMAWTNSPGDSSAGSICCIVTIPVATCSSRSICRSAQRDSSVWGRSSKMNMAARWPRAAAAAANCAASVDLPVPAAPTISVLVPSSSPPPSRASSSGRLTCQLVPGRGLAVFRGDQPREDHDAAPPDDIVVIAAAKLHAAILDDPETPALRPVLGVELLQQERPVRDALHLQIAVGGGQVVQQQHGALAGGKELLERQDLPTIPQRVARKQAQFRQRIEDHAASASGDRHRQG